jgi:hypothetical protein
MAENLTIFHASRFNLFSPLFSLHTNAETKPTIGHQPKDRLAFREQLILDNNEILTDSTTSHDGISLRSIRSTKNSSSVQK